MSDQETTSRDLPKSALTALVSQVSGHLVRPSDPEYGDARRVWNGMIDRYPAAILRCESNADVAAGIRFAREAGLAISVRSGGHNVAGFGTLASAPGGTVAPGCPRSHGPLRGPTQ